MVASFLTMSENDLTSPWSNCGWVKLICWIILVLGVWVVPRQISLFSGIHRNEDCTSSRVGNNEWETIPYIVIHYIVYKI